MTDSGKHRQRKQDKTKHIVSISTIVYVCTIMLRFATVDRVSFFQQIAQEHPEDFTLDEIHVIIHKYVFLLVASLASAKMTLLAISNVTKKRSTNSKLNVDQADQHHHDRISSRKPSILRRRSTSLASGCPTSRTS
jgi:hypothetical protein